MHGDENANKYALNFVLIWTSHICATYLHKGKVKIRMSLCLLKHYTVSSEGRAQSFLTLALQEMIVVYLTTLLQQVKLNSVE
jgi:hypothetical protein